MKTLSYCVILCACLILSCRKAKLPEEQTVLPGETLNSNEYTIRKGNHYCEETEYLLMNSATVRAKVTFDSSAIYTLVDSLNQRDVNKLVGFSDCGTDHHQNSARLGWSWNGSQVVMYAYAYVNRARIIKTLGTVHLGKSFSCSVISKEGYYHFTADNYRDSIPSHCADYTGTRYKLFPYFGGDEMAPHDIHIGVAEE